MIRFELDGGAVLFVRSRDISAVHEYCGATKLILRSGHEFEINDGEHDIKEIMGKILAEDSNRREAP